MSRFMKTMDTVAEGKGWAMGQMKVTRADGTIEYHFSAPQFRWFNIKGWLWYLAHRQDIIKRRATP